MAINDIINDLTGTDPVAREQAVHLLNDIGEPAIAQLKALSESDNKLWRWQAVKVLGKMHDKAAATVLLDKLEDNNSAIRWLAAEGLIRMGPGIINPVLKRLINRPDSDYLRRQVVHILSVLRDDVPFRKSVTLFLEKLKTCPPRLILIKLTLRLLRDSVLFKNYDFPVDRFIHSS
jgi:HEAT repeat protein